MASPYGAYKRLTITAPAPYVLQCSLDRPQKLNAFDNLMWAEIRDFFAAVADDSKCRAILVSGEGRGFTAGLDLMDAGGLSGGDQDEEEDPARKGLRIRRTGKEWQASFTNIQECGKPVVAAVHGPCIGAGIEMIAACDVRFCSTDAFFEMAEVRRRRESRAGG